MYRAIPIAICLICFATASQSQVTTHITQIEHTPPNGIRVEGQATPGATCFLQAATNGGASFIDLPNGARTAAEDGAVAWISDPGNAPQSFYRIRQPHERRLLTWADIEESFAGTFAVPMAEEDDWRFGYSSGVHAQLENGNLLVVGHPYHEGQAQVQLPDILDGREGTRVGAWIDITQGLLPAGWSSQRERSTLGGLLQLGESIHFTKHEWYNGDGTDWATQGAYVGALDGSGNAAGMWTVQNEYAHHSRVGGYICAPPQALAEAGFAYLAGLQGTSGAALGRWGPNLFAISTAVTNGALPAATLLCHPTESLQVAPVLASNATSEWWAANGADNEAWWIGNKVTDIRWIETESRHGVLCFVCRGLGHRWYGDANNGPGFPDPYGGGSGFHAEGWVLEAWIYDPDEVMQVYRGERAAWSLTPAEAVLLTERLPGTANENHYSFFTGRAQTELKGSLLGNRFVLLQENEHPASEWESTPKGYVFLLP